MLGIKYALNARPNSIEYEIEYQLFLNNIL